MAKKKDTKGKTLKSLKELPKTEELGLKGKGAEKLHIAAIEKAAEKYVIARDERMELTTKEHETKIVLMAAMKEHRAELIPDGDGGVFYTFGDKRVTLKPTDETVKVSKVDDGSLEVSKE